MGNRVVQVAFATFIRARDISFTASGMKPGTRIFPFFDSEDVSNDHLSNLKFTFPSVDKEFDYENKAKFIIDYNAKYGIAPNKYAVRGYDIMYDTLLRLANSDTYMESLENNIATEYIENKFSYVENGISGYMNNGIYIMQYGENLTLKPVE